MPAINDTTPGLRMLHTLMPMARVGSISYCKLHTFDVNDPCTVVAMKAAKVCIGAAVYARVRTFLGRHDVNEVCFVLCVVVSSELPLVTASNSFHDAGEPLIEHGIDLKTN